MRVPIVGDAKAMRLTFRHVLDSLGFDLFGAVRSKSALEGARLLMVVNEEDPDRLGLPLQAGISENLQKPAAQHVVLKQVRALGLVPGCI